ncbi:bifunctional enoyl-CoA hydratase/phosphate acetyltransferase [candidate division KSB1 bacterium]|nr:bifunctional enoyl-CoA hydratase/phosphate acetyltransferase [candidate division KSB1 bacterium]
MINTLDDLITHARKGRRVKVAVAGAENRSALQAIIEAVRMGIAEGLLFGRVSRIEKFLADLPEDIRNFLTVHEGGTERETAHLSVDAVRTKRANILLKGKVKSNVLLKAVLDAETGLRTGKLLSDIFMFENPNRDRKKLTMITDGGVVLKPTIAQKIQIIENAVSVAHALGNLNPKVALLSAIENINPAIPATLDAAIITKMNHRHQITGCVIDGPFALDNAVSLEAARIKRVRSRVAGKADILVCPEIESANMLAKSTTYFANFRLAHVTMGASAPILIPSRADTAEAKLLSIALGKFIFIHSRKKVGK